MSTKRLLLIVLWIHAIFPIAWIAMVIRHGPLPNDWLHLKIVADHFVAGDWGQLYASGPESVNPGYLWRYPPFALYAVAPLAWLSDPAAYVVLALIEVAAIAASLRILERLVVLPPSRTIWILAVALSAPALTTVIAGQSSGLILFAVSCGAWLLFRDRPVAAGVVLGLLALKPNWGAAFGLMALVSGQWRLAGAMAGTAALLVVSSLPLGLSLWQDFLGLSALNDEIMGTYAAFKVITLKGFLDGTLGPGSVATALWLVGVVTMTVVASVGWRRLRSPTDRMATALLLTVAANPYASFYDALALAFPATVWWAQRQSWRPFAWRFVGAGIAAAWCTEHLVYTWRDMLVGGDWSPSFSIVGVFATVWLILAAGPGRVATFQRSEMV